jgi:hypothetical protein
MSIITPSLIDFTSNTQWGDQNCHTGVHAVHTGLFFHNTAHSKHDVPSKGVLDESFFTRFWEILLRI